MARKETKDAERTDQINFRFKVALLDRMERYRERHPLRPTLTQIAATAIAEWLDHHEPALPKPKAK